MDRTVSWLHAMLTEQRLSCAPPAYRGGRARIATRRRSSVGLRRSVGRRVVALGMLLAGERDPVRLTRPATR